MKIIEVTIELVEEVLCLYVNLSDLNFVLAFLLTLTLIFS